MLLLLKLNISWRARLPWMITIPSWYVCWSKTRLGSKMESKKGQFFQFTLKHRHYSLSFAGIKDKTSNEQIQPQLPLNSMSFLSSSDMARVPTSSFCTPRVSTVAMPLPAWKDRRWTFVKTGIHRCDAKMVKPDVSTKAKVLIIFGWTLQLHFFIPFQRADQWTPWGWQLIHMSDSWITIRYKQSMSYHAKLRRFFHRMPIEELVPSSLSTLNKYRMIYDAFLSLDHLDLQTSKVSKPFLQLSFEAK